MMFSGLPSLRAASARISRSLSTSRRIEVLLRHGAGILRDDVHGDVLGRLGVAALDLDQRGDRPVVMSVAAARPSMRAMRPTLNTSRMRLNRSSFDVLQRLAGLRGGGLLEQLLAGLCAGAGGKLLGQIVGELLELGAVGHRGAFALQLDHGADVLVQIDVDRDAAGAGFATEASLLGLDALPCAATRWPFLRRRQPRCRAVCNPSSADRSSRAAT